MVASIQPRKKRSTHASKMEDASGTGGEACANGHYSACEPGRLGLLTEANTFADERASQSYSRSHYGVGERRACIVVGQPRSVQGCRSRRPPQEALKRRIKEVAEVRVRYWLQAYPRPLAARGLAD